MTRAGMASAALPARPVTRSVGALVLGLAVALVSAGPTQADVPLTATATPDADASSIADFGSDLHVQLRLSQPVPWRAFVVDAPPRLVLDFAQVDWTGSDMAANVVSDSVEDVTAGPYRDGWSRMVVQLTQPMEVETAGLASDADATTVKLQLTPVSQDRFDAIAGAPDGADIDPPPTGPPVPARPYVGDRPLVVAVDPGHGGVDPGAVAGDTTEAALLLEVATALAGALRDAGVEAVLTRESDLFVPVEGRAGMARTAGADIFVSLHADAVAAGDGAAVRVCPLTWVDAASSPRPPPGADAPTLLAGMDVFAALDGTAFRDPSMSLTRAITQANDTAGPRTARLAAALRTALGGDTAAEVACADGGVRLGLIETAPPGVPSVLVELGSMSSPRDLARLTSPDWRARTIAGVRDAILRWAEVDAADARLRLRQ